MDNFSLFDGSLAPLKRYLSASLGPQQPTADQQQQELRSMSASTAHDDRLRDSMFGDWGIEDYKDLSSPTLVNDYTTSSEMGEADTPLVEQHIFSDWGVSPTKTAKPLSIKHSNMTLRLPKQKEIRRSRGLRDVLHLLLKKRELMEEECSAFLDEFKYVLVTSQLLDETILVSRFYNKKKSSTFNLNSAEKSSITTDFGTIVRISSKFCISSPIPHYNIIRTAFITRYLHNNQHIHTTQQLRVGISVILITLWLHTRSRNIRLSIIQTTLLNRLKHFIKKYQKFDTSIQRLLNKYKEVALYTNVISSSPPEVVDTEALHQIINSTVFISTEALLKALKDLLPLVNSTELENYCGIYNIEIPDLVFLLDDSNPETTQSSDFLIHKIKRFQFIRRFFICALLAFSLEPSAPSEFTTTVGKVFDLSLTDSSSPISIKWCQVRESLDELQTFNTVLVQSISNFVVTHQLKLGSLPIHDQSRRSSVHQISDPTIDLMKKLKRIQVDLLTFNRDNTAEDQVSEFKTIGLLLESLNQTYQKNLSTLESSTHTRQFHLSKRISSRSSKRFSLPSTQHLSIISPPQSASSSSNRSPVTMGHKRLSSGLGMPLLTVLEDGDASAYISQNDYITDHNLLSNDDSVIVSTNTDDMSFEGLSPLELKKRLESTFERLTSTSTTVEEMIGREPTETNKNDLKVSEEDGAPLMDELVAALKNRG